MSLRLLICWVFIYRWLFSVFIHAFFICLPFFFSLFFSALLFSLCLAASSDGNVLGSLLGLSPCILQFTEIYRGLFSLRVLTNTQHRRASSSDAVLHSFLFLLCSSSCLGFSRPTEIAKDPEQIVRLYGEQVQGRGCEMGDDQAGSRRQASGGQIQD